MTILFSILIFFASYNGQVTTHPNGEGFINQYSIGDTVPELGKSILIIFQAKMKISSCDRRLLGQAADPEDGQLAT